VRTIGVVTVARSDYGIYRPLLQKIAADPDLRLQIYVAGGHLSAAQGLTLKQIEADGYAIVARLDTLLPSDAPEAISQSIGLGVSAFAQAFSISRPDILVVLGDRFDMYVAALAALPFKLPVLHIHGGEVTEGAIDDSLRHSLTKLSHLHCVASKEYARRVLQLGEEPWRVTVSGALSLDNLSTVARLSRAELEERWKLKLDQPFLLATFHPVTLEFEKTAWHAEQFLSALETINLPVIATLPNIDTYGQIIIDQMKRHSKTHPTFQLVDSLGVQGYFSLMTLAAAMAGNSSSGILEAPSFKLPVVNVGTRQKGRTRAANVIDVDYCSSDIVAGLQRALSTEFRAKLSDMRSPFEYGNAAEIILQRLKSTELNQALLQKQFVDLPAEAYSAA